LPQQPRFLCKVLNKTPRQPKAEARQSLSEAIALILEDRREDALKGIPPEAERETVIVE